MTYPLSPQKQSNNDKLNNIKKYVDNVISDVIVKSLFSGYGFYQDSNMFAIFQSGAFYLRAEDNLATQLERLDCKACTKSENQALSSDYYCLPNSIIEDDKLLKSLIEASIKQLVDKKSRIKQIERMRIKQLINLSYKHERSLSQVGIDSISRLQRVGAEKAYALLKQNGISVNLQFFWNLYAALLNIPVGLLTKEQQYAAFNKLQIELAKSGLRPEKFRSPY
ncbi:TfoX/Sxy family DNA transformation protein [Pasteurellaceae bacterium HPA106]|uniref:TfoX/Sxy family protein n=1 Tax=Spirabiliibacterium pneumoniae TaxID=221400 RepID=UPI001AAC8D2B|nr:TfoX/Sxy family protein [Spirabiliibacterium pneumoniae]MBE2896832.1 TfoX/Sxy family DNA transformation protein [Spirabiliibacterium pneumoniae]